MYLKERRQLLGEERIRQVEAEWQELIRQARAEMENGSALESESVQALARHWHQLIQEFTGGDAGIERSLLTMYQQEEPEVASRGALDAAVMEYMSKAIIKVVQRDRSISTVDDVTKMD